MALVERELVRMGISLQHGHYCIEAIGDKAGSQRIRRVVDLLNVCQVGGGLDSSAGNREGEHEKAENGDKAHSMEDV